MKPLTVKDKVITVSKTFGTYSTTIRTVTSILGGKLELDNRELIDKDSVYPTRWTKRINEILDYCNKDKSKNPFDMLRDLRRFHLTQNIIEPENTPRIVTDTIRKKIAQELRESGIYKPTRKPKKKNSWKEL